MSATQSWNWDWDAGAAWRRLHDVVSAHLAPRVIAPLEPECAANMARLEAAFGRPLGPGVRSFFAATRVRHCPVDVICLTHFACIRYD
jgi:cytochrome P450